MSRLSSHVTVGLTILAGALAVMPASASATFGFRPGSEGFSVAAREEDGALDHQAGSHPYELVTSVRLNTTNSPGEPGVPFSEGDPRELALEFPPGLIENPIAASQCTLAAFHEPRVSALEPESLSGENCPDSSQVGVVTVRSSYGGGIERTFGVFSLASPPGAPAEVGFNPFGSPVIFTPELHQAEGEYQLTLRAADISQRVNFSAMRIALWGAPWAASHNGERGDCLDEAEPETPWDNSCAAGPRPEFTPRAYLTLPSSCHQSLIFGATATSWQEPGTVTRRVFAHFGEGEAQALEGCASLPFETSARALLADPRASSPSGFEFDLDVSSAGLLNPKRLNPPAARTAVVTLPQGLTINPSVGSGLLGCSPSQYAAETAASPPGSACPNGSKIGDFTVRSPIFPEEIEGSIFLATPFANPFGTLVGLYLVAKEPAHGVLVEVAGKLDPDPVTGSLVATFERLPQLPYTNLRIHFREGQRSPLATPAVCRAFQTLVTLTPWSGAGGEISSGLPTPVTSGAEGNPCPTGLPAFGPKAVAGSINSQAGAFTPFYIHLTRGDTEQEITSYSTVLPPGLVGRIAGIPYCSDAAIETARQAGGFEEEERPSCPAASEIGHTVSGYGVGVALNYAPGKLYLAGPFHGSTFSVVAIDSATVGPFDLGTVVVRSAIDVDPQTARVSIDSTGSDPIPHIIDGIPIHLRDIRVYVSRPDLTVNPTSCEPFKVESRLTGSGADFGSPADDTTAVATSPYQAFNCGSVPFRPRLKLRLRGGTGRGAFPALRAELRPRSGDANVEQAKVTLPASEFLEQRHIKTICARPQFAAETCPAASVYGSAQAFSPLLAQPLQGPVYLRSSPGRQLPDLVADLHGGGLGLRIEVVGHIDSVHGGLRGTFEGIPDAAVSRFVLNLKGGKRGLLVNSQDTCAAEQHADARFVGHNDVGIRLRPKIEVNCAKSKRGRRG